MLHCLNNLSAAQSWAAVNIKNELPGVSFLVLLKRYVFIYGLKGIQSDLYFCDFVKIYYMEFFNRNLTKSIDNA